MNKDLLIALSNADAIASKESEVRDLLYQEMKDYADEVSCDRLGSVIFHKKGNGPKIMFCAHMDEVGFEVRHISDIGMLYLIPIGGVRDTSKEMQRVRVTTSTGKKVYGLLNVTRDGNGKIKDHYVDLGVDSKSEVEALGVQIGDMVCFDSNCNTLNQEKVFAGKAMDDRIGCYILAEAIKRIQKEHHENDLYFVGTSSEEVGVRGGKTATYEVDPDLIVAIDVANHPELSRDFTNTRKIGHGCMIVHYDKTMMPNEKLLKFVKELADTNKIAYQCDMLGGGGTDAGNAHLTKNGKLALVLGIPLRYCHGSYSLVHEDDVEYAISLIVEMIKAIDDNVYKRFIDFLGGK